MSTFVSRDDETIFAVILSAERDVRTMIALTLSVLSPHA
jgi:hypothetical protein